jgi:hypothetical protein
MRSRSPKRRLSVEPLEDRTTPNNGVPWLDPQSLTISFAPDGTSISGSPSNLSALLAGTGDWKREILRAYQTWAVEANLNIGLQSDGGQPFGIAGAPQEDTRFGDIRVGARRLSGAQDDSIAGSTGFDHAGGTWSGDVVLNNAFSFGMNGAADRHDIFSVALHEAGNTLGMKDNWATQASAMWGQYQVRTGLHGVDVSALRALYGARPADRFEGANGNGTLGTATNLGSLTHFNADLTQVGDVDVYKFTAPMSASGLSISLQAAGISLLTARLRVYDAAGNQLATVATTDPTSNNLTLSVPGYQAGATYYVRVEGAGADVFSAGAYILKLNYNVAYGTADVQLKAPYLNYEWFGNNAQASAAVLDPISAGNRATFAAVGMLLSSGESDWYRITPTGASGTLTVSVWAWGGSNLLPMVRVYNSAGQLVSADVVANENGLFTVQLPNQAAGATFFLKVSALDPSGTRATGGFVVGASLAPVAPTFYDLMSGSSLSAANRYAFGNLTVTEARLTQFSLSASTAAGAAETAVRMTIYDAAGRKVFTITVRAGQPLVTGTVWLPAGSYRVVYNAATRYAWDPLPDLSFVVGKRERSNPIDPYLVDPDGTPVGSGTGGDPAVTTDNPVLISDPIAISGTTLLDPIVDPFLP